MPFLSTRPDSRTADTSANQSRVRPAGEVRQSARDRLAARVPHLVHRAARDLEHVAGAELALGAVHARAQAALEHLEALVLGGVEVGRRRAAAGSPAPLHLERVLAVAEHSHGLATG